MWCGLDFERGKWHCKDPRFQARFEGKILINFFFAPFSEIRAGANGLNNLGFSRNCFFTENSKFRSLNGTIWQRSNPLSCESMHSVHCTQTLIFTSLLYYIHFEKWERPQNKKFSNNHPESLTQNIPQIQGECNEKKLKFSSKNSPWAFSASCYSEKSNLSIWWIFACRDSVVPFAYWRTVCMPFTAHLLLRWIYSQRIGQWGASTDAEHAV